MNNLTKQLANLYEPKWNELKQQLDAKGIKVQAPFMLGVAWNITTKEVMLTRVGGLMPT